MYQGLMLFPAKHTRKCASNLLGWSILLDLSCFITLILDLSVRFLWKLSRLFFPKINAQLMIKKSQFSVPRRMKGKQKKRLKSCFHSENGLHVPLGGKPMSTLVLVYSGSHRFTECKPFGPFCDKWCELISSPIINGVNCFQVWSPHV